MLVSNGVNCSNGAISVNGVNGANSAKEIATHILLTLNDSNPHTSHPLA